MAMFKLENYIMVMYGFHDIVSDWLFSHGGWEVNQLEQMAAYTDAVATIDPRRDGYLDLGANIGAHAVALVARDYNVYAFGPTHANHMLLRRPLALSGLGKRVRVNAFALGDKPATICIIAKYGRMRRAAAASSQTSCLRASMEQVRRKRTVPISSHDCVPRSMHQTK
ncbi:hypothetical protein DOTSEDRAFT_38910 [Dothistroma septosporum NZE10]|uniref:SAM-dependent methyltransferase TRM5/TYW2-type domain-containing protein n=1 Tax=Dothistroma septosporum (strain NZE10 / CBS 128990) TaxID=675120 RepID=M2XGP7_DOTSN|nr:hypothetical protein DOTSEDRAFT_38910 [Dothistroma septosporum NZE10]